jgi:hypothetical protein
MEDGFFREIGFPKNCFSGECSFVEVCSFRELISYNLYNVKVTKAISIKEFAKVQVRKGVDIPQADDILFVYPKTMNSSAAVSK